MDTETATPTLTARVIGYEEVDFVMDERVIPIAVGFNADGSLQTARALAEREKLDPAACDHAGATWSSNLDMRCPQCGSPMFLPPRLLAHLPANEIHKMAVFWSAAGWPEWRGDGWFIVPFKWTIEPVPLFTDCGGLPVRNDRREQFIDALFGMAEGDVA